MRIGTWVKVNLSGRNGAWPNQKITAFTLGASVAENRAVWRTREQGLLSRQRR